MREYDGMLRRLSEAEGLFLQAGDDMPVGFLMAARIRGEFSLQALREAVSKARRRHPLLAVRVARDAEGQQWLTSEGVPELPVPVVEGVSDDGWIAEAKDALLETFSAATGPLARFIWLRSADGRERSDLMVVCHHGIADGHSGAFLLRDILHHLGHPEAPVEPLPLQPVLLDLISPDVVQRLYEEIKDRLSASSAVAMEELRDKGGMADIWSLPAPRYHLRAWSLTSAQTASLVARCRGERTTVHGALGSAFLTAFAHTLGAKEGAWVRTLQSPVSLRDRLTAPIGEDVGVLMSHILTRVDCSPGRRFWDIARDVRASVRDQLRSEELFTRAVMFKVIAEMVSSQRGIPRHLVEEPSSMVSWDLSLSNLGRLDFPASYGARRLEALRGPIFAAMPGDRIVGVTTFDGRMRLMFICREATMDPPMADQVIDEAMDRLAVAMRC
jgi:hypothetical protein